MKAFLLYRDRDFDLSRPLPWNETILSQDLELDTLLDVMAAGDEFLFGVAKKVLLSSSTEVEEILYRQNVLEDCLKNAPIVRAIYDVAVEAIAEERRNYLGTLSRYPGYILHRSLDVLAMFLGKLKKIRGIAQDHGDAFHSDGFTTFFAMLRKELDDSYLAEVEAHLKRLHFPDGALISAELGKGNKGTNYVLRKPAERRGGLIERIFADRPPTYTYYLEPRDENGASALSDLRDHGINSAANALAQSTDHILGFFTMLRSELAFYLACANLHERLVGKGEPVCFPRPAGRTPRRLAFRGLYDVCLSLHAEQPVVGNDMAADDKNLVVITGANQGGKSTFLRSIGLAQLMMQCGMFVPAQSMTANICEGIFTHYKREEDAEMNSGKFDEELSRMNDIVDGMKSADAMILFNESFAATNEREGSEIADQIISALLEKGIKVVIVTHLYELARRLRAMPGNDAIFMRAERQADGKRNFRLVEGEPLATSYGEDLYRRIFGADQVGAQPVGMNSIDL